MSQKGVFAPATRQPVQFIISEVIVTPLSFVHRAAVFSRRALSFVSVAILASQVSQSVLWSTLIKTISELVSEEMMPRAILVMSTTSVAGTFFAYGFSALFVKLGNWRGMFAFATVALLVTAGIWLDIEREYAGDDVVDHRHGAGYADEADLKPFVVE